MQGIGDVERLSLRLSAGKGRLKDLMPLYSALRSCHHILSVLRGWGGGGGGGGTADDAADEATASSAFGGRLSTLLDECSGLQSLVEACVDVELWRAKGVVRVRASLHPVLQDLHDRMGECEAEVNESLQQVRAGRARALTARGG